MLSMIECAQRMTVLDQFLFNDLLTDAKPVRNICQELTSALVRKQRTVPDIRVYFVTDPCNTLYGALRSSFLETLAAEGVHVITTDLDLKPGLFTVLASAGPSRWKPCRRAMYPTRLTTNRLRFEVCCISPI